MCRCRRYEVEMELYQRVGPFYNLDFICAEPGSPSLEASTGAVITRS